MTSSSWNGLALVVGAGGIGRALVPALRRRCGDLTVVLCGRQLAASEGWCVDLEDPRSLEALRQRVGEALQPLRLVVNTSGRLHGPGLQPEKRLQQVRAEALAASYAINAMAPLLLAQALEPCLERQRPFHFASLSARVGSIGDNHSGGWYAYRAAKAAQNQLLRCLSIEWARRYPQACVTLLHPGTTDTALSRPFQSFVPPGKLFAPARAAEQLLDVLLSQSAADSGAFLAWDGQAIPW
ncbi:short chain dehydrogenase family protein [Synechococcus sp. RS9909]|uniref:SDR family NAD(P)-dependent oxidoreductase n=1 Tax=unclassified Synechococcus TaxID=2626047 RepID=UPI000068F8F3|nr:MULTISPECIES: SDR family NAD(P)-dependent oxidoreductase [unclassified Synechococcus]EAQ69310.1 possible CsgA C-factor signaling protein [Synechococcus sp. RS9917]QNI79437.1 short chain dehydrogenase family protein [Synechococcus sp. RS9909]